MPRAQDTSRTLLHFQTLGRKDEVDINQAKSVLIFKELMRVQILDLILPSTLKNPCHHSSLCLSQSYEPVLKKITLYARRVTATCNFSRVLTEAHRVSSLPTEIYGSHLSWC